MTERRALAVVVGKRGRFLIGEPLFERGGQVPLGGGAKVAPGMIALVEPGSGRGRRSGRARVVRPLGDPTKARDVVEALLADRGVARGFPAKLESEAKEAASRAERAGVNGRRDHRELPTFTVDPATARDFDDAVSAALDGDGIRLWIHIADVAAHVKPGSGLEREAYRRGTSVYVPGTVEPMLPAALSAGACSLSPGDERLAVTSEIGLSGSGEVRSVRFYRSRIRSDARLNYDELDEIFAGRSKPPEPAKEPLALARKAAAALADRRGSSGLEVETPEPAFRFEGADVAGAVDVAETEAHRLIEQLMILDNERVAELCERKRMPTLYRVHEQPDPQRVAVLVEQLGALEVPTPPLPGKLSPRQAGELVAEISRKVAAEAKRRGHGREAYTSLVLRSLKQAHYSDRNLGHAGLGSPAYAHFTSPIRRYPDLVAHRALLSAIGSDEKPARPEHAAEAGPHSSERERDAEKLERAADDVCAAFLLARETLEAGPGKPFEGEVVGLVAAGAFVRFAGELATIYEGFLPARRIGGRERYELDETETKLVGESGGDAVRLGDPVTVTVDRVDAPRGRVDLLPAEPRDDERRA